MDKLRSKKIKSNNSIYFIIYIRNNKFCKKLKDSDFKVRIY